MADHSVSAAPCSTVRLERAETLAYIGSGIRQRGVTELHVETWGCAARSSSFTESLATGADEWDAQRSLAAEGLPGAHSA